LQASSSAFVPGTKLSCGKILGGDDMTHGSEFFFAHSIEPAIPSHAYRKFQVQQDGIHGVLLQQLQPFAPLKALNRL